MPSLRHARVPTTRFLALAIAASAAAMIGLGSAAAHADPTTSATTASAATSTSTASTSTTGASTTVPTSGASTSSPVRPAPGPPCPGVGSTLTPFACLPTGFGEDQPASVGTDGFLEFAAQVVNNGPAVSAASVVITLPDGLRLADEGDEAVNRLEKWWSEDSDEDGTPLACTTSTDGSEITCATGSIPAGANFLVLVDLGAQDNAVAGTSGVLSLVLESSPVVGTFPTTEPVTATVDFVGTAHLQVTLAPATATVTVGKSLTLAATVHNVGPNTAVEASAVGFAFPADYGDDYTFVITNSQPFPGGLSASARSASSTFRLRLLPARFVPAKAGIPTSSSAKAAASKAAAAAPGPIGYWPIGTIAPGATASVQVVVKAVAVGTAELNFGATSADESCDDPDAPGCENVTTAELTAVAAVTTTATTPSATTSTTSTTAPATTPVTTVTTSSAAAAPTLPNTGFRTAPWIGTAGAAILLGFVLMVLGAPRRRACGARHR